MGIDNEKLSILDGVADYSQNVLQKINPAIEDIREGIHFEYVPQIVEGTLVCVEALKALKEFHSVSVDEDYITQVTGDLLDGMENGDCSLIADILEYEFKPMFRNWYDLIKETVENA